MGKASVPFIGPEVANWEVKEEWERQPVVELFNDFSYEEPKWWGGLGSIRKRRTTRRWLSLLLLVVRWHGATASAGGRAWSQEMAATGGWREWDTVTPWFSYGNKTLNN
jgi:hypothetical protein